MKGPLDRTKVVLRHLPPTISQSNLVEHIDLRFSGRYRWLTFRPGKSGPKHLTYARAYIDFNKPEDVIEFAEFFKGHVFVNEKGTQFRTLVEYAPSQRVPKPYSKKDGREGTILKDPEYLEFLEFIAKPVENLPSAEIQLERKEAERAGAPKDAPIVTALMDFVRQKRAAKGGARRAVLNGKPARRVGGMSSRNSVSGSSKRGSDKRTTTTMYVLRDSSKVVSSKDKSTYLLNPKHDDQKLNDKSVNSSAISGNETLEGESGGSGTGYAGTGKKKILLSKGKEKEIPNVSGGPLLQQNTASPDKASQSYASPKQNQASGRIIRSILLNRDTRQNQLTSGSQSEIRVQSSNQERDKRPPRPPSVTLLLKDTNGAPEDKVICNEVPPEKPERRTRNKDRPDRGVWTPLRRSDGSHSSDDSLSSSASQTSQVVDAAEGVEKGTHVDLKQDVLVGRSGEYRITGSGRGRHFSTDNGSYRHGARRGSVYTVKNGDGSSVVEGKSLKRAGSSGFGSEKQVWVQKSSSGT